MIESSCVVSVPRLAEDESSVCTCCRLLQSPAGRCTPAAGSCRSLQSGGPGTQTTVCSAQTQGAVTPHCSTPVIILWRGNNLLG